MTNQDDVIITTFGGSFRHSDCVIKYSLQSVPINSILLLIMNRRSIKNADFALLFRK